MFLKTKLAEYGPEACTRDEIKKLTSWGMYNPYTWEKNNRRRAASRVAQMETGYAAGGCDAENNQEPGEAQSAESLCSRFSKRSGRAKRNETAEVTSNSGLSSGND